MNEGAHIMRDEDFPWDRGEGRSRRRRSGGPLFDSVTGAKHGKTGGLRYGEIRRQRKKYRDALKGGPCEKCGRLGDKPRRPQSKDPETGRFVRRAPEWPGASPPGPAPEPTAPPVGTAPPKPEAPPEPRVLYLVPLNGVRPQGVESVFHSPWPPGPGDAAHYRRTLGYDEVRW